MKKIILILTLIAIILAVSTQAQIKLPRLGDPSDKIIEQYNIYKYVSEYVKINTYTIIKGEDVFKFEDNKLIYYIIKINKKEMKLYKKKFTKQSSDYTQGKSNSGYIIEEKESCIMYYLQDVEVNNHINYYISSHSCT